MNLRQSQINKLQAFLFDVDGVLWVNGKANSHAAALISKLREELEIPFRFLTNDCTATDVMRQHHLSQGGIWCHANEVITAVTLTHIWLSKNNIKEIMYLGSDSIGHSFWDNGYLKSSAPEVVVLGDLFDSYNRGLIEEAASHIREGAKFLAMQRNRTWYDGVHIRIDNGFWVSALEYVTGVDAITVGKPSKFAYFTGCREMGIDNNYQSVLMLSDDYKSDLKGAKELGLITALLSSTPPSKLPKWVDFVFRDLEEFMCNLQVFNNAE